MGAAAASPEVIAAGVSGGAGLLGGFLQGSENARAEKAAREAQIKAQRENTAMGLYAGGPWAATLPYMQSNLTNLVGQYNDPNRQYINTQAGSNEGLNQAISMGLQSTPYDLAKQQIGQGQSLVSNVGSGLSNYMNTGGMNVGANDVTSYANQLLNPSLINSQVDAYSRDIARNLGENQLTGIRSADIATGNLGSSRGGVQEAIARRGAEDRIADFRGNLVGNALSQAGSQLQSNVGNTMSGYQAMLGAGNAAQQGASNLLNVSQDQLMQLYNVGKAQQGLEQANLTNQIGARDFGLTNQQNLANALQNYQGVGNLINYGALNPSLANYTPPTAPAQPQASTGYNLLNIPKLPSFH